LLGNIVLSAAAAGLVGPRSYEILNGLGLFVDCSCGFARRSTGSSISAQPPTVCFRLKRWSV